MADVPSHHLIYGTCKDFITGEAIVDTDDERIRQELARMLVDEKGYNKKNIVVRQKIETLFAKQFVVSTIDFIINLQNKQVMIIRYGPGSLVTRERPAIAAARVLNPAYRIPLAVVTNGRDAELLDTGTGKVLNTGMQAIPDMQTSITLLKELEFLPFNDQAKKERELRILNAFDVEICCAGAPCILPDAPEG